MTKETIQINIEEPNKKTDKASKPQKSKRVKKATKPSKSTRSRKNADRTKTLRERRLEQSDAGVGHTTALGALAERIRHIKGFNLFALVMFVIVILVLILVSFIKLNVPIAEICSLVILEALLASLLSKIKWWIHIPILLVQLLCGFFLSMVDFTIINVIIYLLSLLLIHVWMKDEY